MSLFFCHACNAHVSILLDEADQEPHCAQCGSTFVEEVEQQPEFQYGVIPASDEYNTPEIRFFSAVIDDEHKAPDLFNMMSGLLGGIFNSNNMFQLSDIQMIHGSALGDYGVGTSFSDILEYLRNAQPDRFGRPPAPQEAIHNLTELEINADNKSDPKLENCAICQEEFEIGEIAKCLPCEHYFHPNCVIPWLKQCNSCPVCRAPLEDKGKQEQ